MVRIIVIIEGALFHIGVRMLGCTLVRNQFSSLDWELART
jgi:hypothetical protein